MDGDSLIIGIGCNVMSAPEVNAVKLAMPLSLHAGVITEAGNCPDATTTCGARDSAAVTTATAPSATATATATATAAPIREATCIAYYNKTYREALILLQEESAAGAAVAAVDTGALSLSPPVESSVDDSSIDVAKRYKEFMHTTFTSTDFHKELSVELCENLHFWLQQQTDTAAKVLDDFAENMDYSIQRLRDEPNENIALVEPTGLNSDGTLRVRVIYGVFALVVS
jgi:hypothetical protein